MLGIVLKAQWSFGSWCDWTLRWLTASSTFKVSVYLGALGCRFELFEQRRPHFEKHSFCLAKSIFSALIEGRRDRYRRVAKAPSASSPYDAEFNMRWTSVGAFPPTATLASDGNQRLFSPRGKNLFRRCVSFFLSHVGIAFVSVPFWPQLAVLLWSTPFCPERH